MLPSAWASGRGVHGLRLSGMLSRGEPSALLPTLCEPQTGQTSSDNNRVSPVLGPTLNNGSSYRYEPLRHCFLFSFRLFVIFVILLKTFGYQEVGGGGKVRISGNCPFN